MFICFFSDDKANRFKPLTLTRPLDDLRIGILTIREKWLKSFRPNGWTRVIDEHLQPVHGGNTFETNEKEVLWINSRFLPNNQIISLIKNLEINAGFTSADELIAARIPLTNSNGIKIPSISKSIELDIDQSHRLDYFWDILHLNASEIRSDLAHLPASFTKKIIFPTGVILKNSESIFIDETAKIEPGCIFMADDGPIYIGPNAKIEAGTIIKGPVAICESAAIKMSARIFNGSTIGPVCKVGGEINNCIFHSYSNKAHDGFAGNSIIGQWCNFGADTNTSNLKNNYSEVHLPDWDTGKLSNHGVQFFGTVFGDFSKTAINTSLNTGTVCGVSSNIFCSGFPPKVIPSFSWLGDGSTETYDFGKAIEAMKAIMKRRNVEITPEFIQMMRQIFSLENSASS